MSTLEKTVTEMRSFTTTVWDDSMRMKAEGTLSSQVAADNSLFGGQQSNAQNRQRYGQYHGWLYSAVNALATEGAGQDSFLGRTSLTERTRRSLTRVKGNYHALTKEEQGNLEILDDHPFLETLRNPNPIQGPWQFLYSFIANINLTGWGYIVGGETDEGKFEIYSLPTTWVTPDHKEGPFSKFKVKNPKTTGEKPLELDRDNVCFAYIPNPADPVGALAPASSQSRAIRIDDHIQTSQERFFENGIFPSVSITIGNNPHPDVPAGVRPRLTGAQRRQINSVIRKVSGGIYNYGNPLILDGLIEKIERLSMNGQEMGWDKSEDKARTRLLSAFAVHPFILGEPINVGGHAQAFVIENRFCKRVNTFLTMGGRVLSNFFSRIADEPLMVWFDPCEAIDRDQERRWWETARKNNDVSRNEFRAKMGLPSDESENRSVLLSTVGGMSGSLQIMNAVGQGQITPEAGAAALALFLEIEDSQARRLVDTFSESETTQEAVRTLQRAIEAVNAPLLR